MRTLRLPAVPVNHEGVVADCKPVPLGHGRLALLDTAVNELFDPAAIETQDVIVMRPGIELEHRHAIGKVMPRDEPRRLELREHPVHRREADVFLQIDEAPVNVFGRKMARAAFLEDVENLHARQRDLQPGFAQVIAFHFGLPIFNGLFRVEY